MPSCSTRSYGSFCPVAQASKVVAQRWVPLIPREIMVGNHRFNQIRHALPLISPSVLAQRPKAMEDAGVIYRRVVRGGAVYHLTAAGDELRPIVDSLADGRGNGLPESFTGPRSE
jgi:DNA-binding HxlR family transcriptional regulator